MTLTLSEAIKQGAQLRPQAFGALFRKADAGSDETLMGSCALGAAFEATGEIPSIEEGNHYEIYDELEEHFAILRTRATCPECDHPAMRNNTLGAVITHLNDSHFYTREQIAAWVAQQEAR